MYHINKEITGNGENLTLQNTAKHYFKKFDILGNSKRETREGYNLLPNTATTQTINGVTFTVNKDGSILANGTANLNAILNIYSNLTLKLGITYKINGCATGGGETTYRLLFSDSSFTDNTADIGNGAILTTTTENKYIARIIVYGGATVNNVVFKPMIVEGTETKPYEPYGVSPSIDYPSEVKSVGDDINKFDKDNIADKLIDTSTGGLISNSSWKSSDYIEVTQLTDYIISWLSNSSYFQARIGMYDMNKTYISALSFELNNTYQKSFQTAENCKYIIVNYSVKVNGTNVIRDNIKLEEGTTATPYSPYGQGSIEIYNGNKNFFDKNNIIQGYFMSTSLYSNSEWCYSIANGLKAGETYTTSGGRCMLSYFNGNTNISVDDITNKTITIPENTTKVYISTLKTNVNTLQVEKGKIATEYIQGKSQTKALYTQQPFRAIGDVRDRFVKQDGVNKEEHTIKRIIFNGTENFKLASSNETYTKFYLDTTYPYSSNPLSAICNYLIYGSMSTTNDNCFSSYTKSGLYFGINIKIKTSIASTVSELQAWLAEKYANGTPLYVDYILKTPELIECTPEQVEVLEYFDKEASSYDGTTNIFSTDEISPIFEVIAYQKISDEFKERLKQGKITRGYLKVLATDTLPEIIIDENNYLKDLKIEELRYVPEEGFIGGAVAKRVSGNFNNVDNSFNIQDREIEVYLGVELEDETTEYIKYGTYIVQRPEDDQVTDNTSFEALDYMVKFNQEYKDRITYPCKLKELLNDVLDQAGVNSKTNTFANSDFIVENNQFEQGTTLRDVIKAIAQIAFNWARIDEDDNFVMDFEINEEVDEELSTDDYFSFKKSDDYGPVNVIVLRNSQVEGENVTIKDENLINSASGYNELKITATSKTENGITFTVNEDGTILVNGTSTADTSFLVQKLTAYETGEYILSDEANGSGTTYFTRLYRGSSGYDTIAQTTAGTAKFLLNEDTEFRTYILIKPNTTLNNILFKPMICKGNEKKEFQPYIPFGEIELVIADNPFAYTELKRKQLIEAGRRLFGLRYTPMTVDMLGLMYLNAKDRISVENFNGEKFNTYLLDHTIDYTGIVLDSMQSQAKTKTETKYQYISSLAQGLSHVEIKVDKVNKKIESIVQTQEDVSEKVAKTVARIEVVYALSDSSTVAPTDGWSTTAPEWTAGKYMWQKTITTYANGTTAETAATNISGAKGEAGQNGIGIIQTNITYQKSTSGTTVPTGTWQTTIPEVDENGYLWTRTEFIYSDGSKKYAYNVGKKGATGIGVKSLVDQYYLSTSNTEQTGGEWTEIQPEWQDNTYIWTRTKINWTDNSITYTDPVLANTLNDINSNIVVLRELSSSQIVENGKIITRIEETTKRLNNDYSTTEQVDSKINGLEDKYKTLEKRFVDIEASNKEYAIKINAIDNNGVDKVKTLMGYTFNDNGLNINRDNADTGTIVDEAGVQVLDKTGAKNTPLLYAGYVKEGNPDFPDYEGQTIVATSNLIVKNFLVIGSNSRFQDYTNPILGGQGTGAYDI